MRETTPTIELEKRIYKRLEHIDKDVEVLVKSNYRVISMLVPVVKPTKREVAMFKQREKEKMVPLERIEKRLKNG